MIFHTHHWRYLKSYFQSFLLHQILQRLFATCKVQQWKKYFYISEIPLDTGENRNPFIIIYKAVVQNIQGINSIKKQLKLVEHLHTNAQKTKST